MNTSGVGKCSRRFVGGRATNVVGCVERVDSSPRVVGYFGFGHRGGRCLCRLRHDSTSIEYTGVFGPHIVNAANSSCGMGRRDRRKGGSIT